MYKGSDLSGVTPTSTRLCVTLYMSVKEVINFSSKNFGMFNKKDNKKDGMRYIKYRGIIEEFNSIVRYSIGLTNMIINA